MQKGWEEYLRTRGNGKAIENPGGFVVRAAFFRAIDELRREGREADGVVLDAVIDSGAARASEPSTEEAAIAYVRVDELRSAVGQLSPEEQRVLSLHYFEELSAQASAAALFCSERTYRRRLKGALRRLCRILDAPVPEPGSELAIEIGLAAWVGLRGADVALAHGFPQAFLGLLERGREGANWVLDRVRGPATRLDAGGGGEKIGAIASGPIGKVAGAARAPPRSVFSAGRSARAWAVQVTSSATGTPEPHTSRRANPPSETPVSHCPPLIRSRPPLHHRSRPRAETNRARHKGNDSPVAPIDVRSRSSSPRPLGSQAKPPRRVAPARPRRLQRNRSP